MYHTPDQEDVKRFSKDYTSVLRNPGEEDNLKRKFFEEGLFSIRVTVLGPNICLLEDLVGEDLEAMLQERRVWWDHLFVSVNPWKPTDVDSERLVWLKIFGVPCHAWGECLFRSLEDSIGRFVKIDEVTKLRWRMDIARVCLCYIGKKRVFATIKVVVNGISFEVHVMDEDSCDRTVVEGRRVWEDDGTYFVMSSKEEDGTSEEMEEKTGSVFSKDGEGTKGDDVIVAEEKGEGVAVRASLIHF